MPDAVRTEESIFAEALEKSTPEERAAFLDGACRHDGDLRARIMSLLKSHEQAGSFLGNKLAATVIQPPLAEGPGTVIGPYKLLQQIGEGGMGTVFMAEQTAPVRRIVALKIIKPGMDSAQIIARFEAERQALAMMEHQNIARVLDAGTTENGRPYFVMELVKGIPITRFCDEHNFTPRQRMELFIPVCQAVQHAHTKGVIHRDLKPSNVLVALYDDKPVPKVIDFGVAKATGEKLTERTLFTGFGSFVGTLEYMSPEQARLNALDIDTRSDVYSLGVLLYELLTGSTPLEHERLKQSALDELLRMIREEEPPKPSTRLSQTWSAERGARMSVGPQLSALRALRLQELDWIVMKALDKDRTRRYETANGLARDIQHYLADEPVEACPPTVGYRLRKFARKNKKLLASVSAFTVLLLVGIITSTWQAVRATRAENRALANECEAQRSAAQANAVLAFLQDQVLAAARPESQGGGLGRNVTLREAVDAAEPKIAAAFRDQPLIEASSRDVLGTTYLFLGETALAIRQYERAGELRLARLGPDHPDTLNSVNNLATAYENAGRLTEAITLFEDVLKRKKTILGVDHRETLIGVNNLANTYRHAGRLTEAIGLHEKTLQKRKAALGADHADTLFSMSNLASAYQQAGRFAEARALNEETLRRRQATLGPNHPETLTSMNNLATDDLAAGRQDEALQLFEEALRLRKSQQGPDHPETLKSMNNLAAAYLEAGRSPEALALHEQTLKLIRTKLGSEHPDTLMSMHNLAATYYYAGRLDEARALYEETLKLKKAKLGPDHPETLLGMESLAHNYQDQGEDARAESLFREVVSLRKQKYALQHPWVALTLLSLGQNLGKQQKYAETEPIVREALAIYRKSLPDDWHAFYAQSLLGGSLVGQQKFAEAEPLLLTSYEQLQARAARIPAFERFRVTEARERLVQLYETWGQPEQAREWRTKLPAEPPAKPSAPESSGTTVPPH